MAEKKEKPSGVKTERVVGQNRNGKPAMFGWCMTNEHEACRDFYYCTVREKYDFCGCSCHEKFVFIEEKETASGKQPRAKKQKRTPDLQGGRRDAGNQDSVSVEIPKKRSSSRT